MKHTEDERKAIREFACSVTGSGFAFRDDAIAAHRALLTRVRLDRKSMPYGDPYFEFMREVDTPVPDYSLRARLRHKIIHEHS